jgi:hypothetical protein
VRGLQVVAWELWFQNNTNGLVKIGYTGSGSGGGRADLISGAAVVLCCASAHRAVSLLTRMNAFWLRSGECRQKQQ